MLRRRKLDVRTGIPTSTTSTAATAAPCDVIRNPRNTSRNVTKTAAGTASASANGDVTQQQVRKVTLTVKVSGFKRRSKKFYGNVRHGGDLVVLKIYW